MIRQQQAQIDTLTAGQQQPSNSAVDDSTPTSERSMSQTRSQSQSAYVPHSTISPLPGAAQPRSRSPFNISRQSSFADRSRGGSNAVSPALRPFPGAGADMHEMLPSPATGRDESAFYQAETQNLTRENQMLKLRIRELGKLDTFTSRSSALQPHMDKPLLIARNGTNNAPERQLAEMNPASHVGHSPVIHSGLAPTAGRGSAEQSTETMQAAASGSAPVE